MNIKMAYRKISFLVLMVFLVLLPACGSAPEETAEPTEEITEVVTEKVPDATEEMLETAEPTDIVEPGSGPFSPDRVILPGSDNDCAELDFPTEVLYQDGIPYITNQIIISGEPQDITRLVDHISITETTPLIPGWSISGLIPVNQTDLHGYDVRMYTIEITSANPNPDAWPVVKSAASFAREKGLVAIPEVNLVTGPPAGQPGGASAGIEGNPGGASVGIEGVGEGAFTGVPDPGLNDFLEQWAFGAGGINLYTGSYTTDARGSGVRVAVFDASPLASFEDDGHSTKYYMGVTTDKNQPFNLCVTSAIDTTLSLDETITNATEHGYYAASLIQAVAPQSEIHLVQALDSELRGNLGMLLELMDAYRFAYPYNLPNSTPAVINLSLGFELNFVAQLDVLSGQFQGEDISTIAREAVDETRELILQLGATSPFPIPAVLSHIERQDLLPQVALPFMVEFLRQEKILVVAAAGNQGTGGVLDDHPVSLSPASFERVIGVMASNHHGDISCFSNRGNVFAPGGDGQDEDCSVDLSVQCPPGTLGCTEAIIGRVLVETHENGFAYWVGTSFATPMVTGLAALVWEANPEYSPQQVMDLILSCSAGGNIDVFETVAAADAGALTCTVP